MKLSYLVVIDTTMSKNEICSLNYYNQKSAATHLTTRTGYPFRQLTCSALLSFSNVWSNDWCLLVRLLPLKSLPPLPE